MEVKTVTPDAISKIIANPSPDSSVHPPNLVVQVIHLKSVGNRFMFTANDGNQTLKGILQSSLSDKASFGDIQNLGLIQILDYTLNGIPNESEKYLLVTKWEAVSPALEAEIKAEVKNKDSGIILKPKQDVEGKAEMKSDLPGTVLKPKQGTVAKSAAQIIHEQRGNTALASRKDMTHRVLPIAALNPYQENWTIKVRVTSKGNLRRYKNARREGNAFNVDLIDKDGTQIQATMFTKAERKFFDRLKVGKAYYISKGTLKVTNKQFKTVQSDFEMSLNEHAGAEEAIDKGVFLPETAFNFVTINQLGLYVNGKDLVDVIGVVQNVSETMSIRRKIDNEMIPKRDITIVDESEKTVVVSLWNDHATTIGQELLAMADKSPVLAIKSVKVGDFQGVSASALSKSIVKINPDIPETKRLRSWYDFKDTSMANVGRAGMTSFRTSGGRSMYTGRVSISHITSNPSLGDDKPVFFSLKAYISLIKPDQAMWYCACKTCNNKVTQVFGSGYWCESCQKNAEECSLRYNMVAKISDASGQAWVSTFNKQAERIIGCSADELNKLKSQEGEENRYQMKLKEVTWAPYTFRVSVAQTEYVNEKRQRIIVKTVAPFDYAAETRFLLGEISKMKAFIM